MASQMRRLVPAKKMITDYSFAGLRLFAASAVSFATFGFPIMVILSASLLALGLFYSAGCGLNLLLVFAIAA